MNQVTAQQFETVIGLEVHLQLNTKTKIFCGCVNEFGKAPNTLTCPVCLGLPGSLPVINKQAVDNAIKIGLAFNCTINPFIKFDRKNYYYPDLPKGYQISQYDLPLASNGCVFIPLPDGRTKKINIKRAHLEEDAGKLIHDNSPNSSLVDYNRTGAPLIEIVTEPDLRNAQEAYDYLQTLKLTLQYLNVSDCDMEKGSLRCDANISIMEKGATEFGKKAEIKNLNSFKAVKAALEFEERRHQQMYLNGVQIIQETRLWNDETQQTLPMRSKEEAHDYRYFPEPDLAPLIIEKEAIEQIRQSLPELPAEKLGRLIKEYKISEYDARILIQDQDIASFFEECAKLYPETKKICNWMIGPYLQELNERKMTPGQMALKPEHLISIIKKVDAGILSNLTAKDTFKFVVESGKSPDEVIQEKGLAQVSDDGTLEKIVDEVMADNPQIVEQIKQGKDKAAAFLIGQAMKKSQGKGNPKKFGDLIKRRFSL